MDDDTTDAQWAQQEQEERERRQMEAIARGQRLLAEFRETNRHFDEFINLRPAPHHERK